MIDPAGPSRVFAGLNGPQREAVSHPSGALLVLAGAGSGKTRVITHRIAHLILERGVRASHIVALTFTNKAAGEMRERVEALLGTRGLGAFIGTFHSFCLRALRRDGARVGLASGFAVYDTDDQIALIKRILKSETADEAPTSPRSFLSRISRAKNAMETPTDLESRAFGHDQRLLCRVWLAYEDALRRANAADFDDLLLRTIRLLTRHEDVGQAYAARCEHLLVDEYQDTNRPQYRLVRSLSSRHGNVCVVGDEDQCIYRFRGAELRNILEFESDHPGARTIRLEQNYRSTATILEAAGALVSRNVQRKGKRLWTENPPGERIELFHAPDDRAEADWISMRIRQLEGGAAFEGMAVLYRTNAQSRQLEEVLRRDQVPYQIVGAVQFYARKEVKDLLAYLRLAANSADDVSFRRVVNTPPRGIGTTTLQLLEDLARSAASSLLDAARRAVAEGLLPGRATRMLAAFLDRIDDLVVRTSTDGVAGLLERVIETTDYEAYLDKAYAGLGAERIENVRSLVSAAVEYAEEGDDASLAGFLDRSALVADADDVGRRPGVTLMTVHCAKGLEFPVVFLCGLEESLLPHVMASGSDEDIEEERRLCYVAMTRARERLLLSRATFRRLKGAFLPNPPSRFLDEIPPRLLDEVAPPAWTAEPAPRFTSAHIRGSSAALAAARPAPPRAVVQSTSRGETGASHEDGYDVGAFVRHPRFGGGRILDREGSGPNLKLTIHFPDYGPKKILPAYTKLRVRTS